MLIECSVENFRSFRDRAVFSMVAANIASQPRTLDEQNVFTIHDDLGLLTSAAIYGANASGKSNLITALRFMRMFVLTSSRETQVGDVIPVEPFLLNPQTAESPSRFEVVFYAGGEQYRYGFAVTQESVAEEWLYRLGSQREIRLFTREEQAIHVNTRSFREGQRLELFTRENALFLSVAAQFNGETARAILNWFRQLSVNAGVSDTSDMVEALTHFDNSPYQAAIEELIHRFDVGINQLFLETGPVVLPANAPPEIIKQFKAMHDAISDTNVTLEQVNVKTIHQQYDIDGQPLGEVTFDMDQHESAGTQRLFALAYPLVRALAEGLVIVIDEMDARIHPNLVVELVRLFNSPETNPRHAQLIFTTHNTNLLNAGLFRRDQIWFVEKSRQGVSDLYSLVEYRVDGKVVRNDASFEKDYVMGRYGAIPFLGDFTTVIGAVHAEAPTTR